MAGNISGLHVFAGDVGPEQLSLLDGNYSALVNPLNDLSTFNNYYVDSGAANALVVNVASEQTVALTDGLVIQVQVAATTTTTTPTLNLNGLGAQLIVTPNGEAVPAGALLAGMYAEFIYNVGAQVWVLLSVSPVLGTTYTIEPTMVGTVPANAHQIGYLGEPINSVSVYTLQLSDQGKFIDASTSVLIPANASVAFPVDTKIRIYCGSAGFININITSDTLIWIPTAATGNRELQSHSLANLRKVAATTWFIWAEAGTIT